MLMNEIHPVIAATDCVITLTLAVKKALDIRRCKCSTPKGIAMLLYGNVELRKKADQLQSSFMDPTLDSPTDLFLANDIHATWDLFHTCTFCEVRARRILIRACWQRGCHEELCGLRRHLRDPLSAPITDCIDLSLEIKSDDGSAGEMEDDFQRLHSKYGPCPNQWNRPVQKIKCPDAELVATTGTHKWTTWWDEVQSVEDVVVTDVLPCSWCRSDVECACRCS